MTLSPRRLILSQLLLDRMEQIAQVAIVPDRVIVLVHTITVCRNGLHSTPAANTASMEPKIRNRCDIIGDSWDQKVVAIWLEPIAATFLGTQVLGSRGP